MKSRPRKYLSREVLGRGGRFTVYRDRIPLKGGKKVIREWACRPSITAIVAEAPDGGFFLVRQFRYGVNRYMWEVPAGTMSDEEKPLACAKRECEEETGHRPGRMVSLGWFAPTPAFSNEIVHLFVAKDLKPTRMNLDDDEHLVVKRFTEAQIKRMLKSRVFIDAKSILAFARYFGKL